MPFSPTPEQLACVDLFDTGESLAIEARAGSGKTSTLRLLAESTPWHGTYLAFNKAIVNDATDKMPANVFCSTAHGMAFRALGHRYAHRLGAARMRSAEVARRLGIDPVTVAFGSQRKPLSPGYLAGLTMRAIDVFCQTADPMPTGAHVPYIEGIDLPNPDGSRGMANNAEIRTHLAPALARAWADLSSLDGSLRFNHGHYLKLWELTDPRIVTDFILFDEAQDANPVMLSIVLGQADHAQLVFVGDSEQQIYAFTGAINALATIPADHRAYLTHSFRFGPAIADQANLMLERLDASPLVTGFDQIVSTVGPVADPDAVLTRTNATAVKEVLEAQRAGTIVALVGGGTEVVAFARAAEDLRKGRFVSHPELACFTSWGEVVEYVAQDEQGGDLKLMVDLVEEFGTETIVRALGKSQPEDEAQLVVSTAHKSKGREWASVRLAGDFKDPTDVDEDISDDELRLLYVAVTRAKHELDLEAVVGTEGQKVPEGSRKLRLVG